MLRKILILLILFSSIISVYAIQTNIRKGQDSSNISSNKVTNVRVSCKKKATNHKIYVISNKKWKNVTKITSKHDKKLEQNLLKEREINNASAIKLVDGLWDVVLMYVFVILMVFVMLILGEITLHDFFK